MKALVVSAFRNHITIASSALSALLSEIKLLV